MTNHRVTDSRLFHFEIVYFHTNQVATYIKTTNPSLRFTAPVELGMGHVVDGTSLMSAACTAQALCSTTVPTRHCRERASEPLLSGEISLSPLLCVCVFLLSLALSPF